MLPLVLLIHLYLSEHRSLESWIGQFQKKSVMDVTVVAVFSNNTNLRIGVIEMSKNIFL